MPHLNSTVVCSLRSSYTFCALTCSLLQLQTPQAPSYLEAFALC